jgi:hypothetical protein
MAEIRGRALEAWHPKAILPRIEVLIDEETVNAEGATPHIGKRTNGSVLIQNISIDAGLAEGARSVIPYFATVTVSVNRNTVRVETLAV